MLEGEKDGCRAGLPRLANGRMGPYCTGLAPRQPATPKRVALAAIQSWCQELLEEAVTEWMESAVLAQVVKRGARQVGRRCTGRPLRHPGGWSELQRGVATSPERSESLTGGLNQGNGVGRSCMGVSHRCGGVVQALQGGVELRKWGRKARSSWPALWRWGREVLPRGLNFGNGLGRSGIAGAQSAQWIS